MASISHGMNVQQVTTLGQQLRTKAGDINAMCSQLQALVNNSTECWVGPDANQFRANWSGIQAALRNASNQLEGFGTKALHNVNAQQATSQQL